MSLHWFVLGVVALCYVFCRRVTQSPFGKVLQAIRENEPRTRAIGYNVERHKMGMVMLSALVAGLSGALYGIFNAYAAPDYFFFLQSGETVIYNVLGGIGTLAGPVLGAGVFHPAQGAVQHLLESRVLPDTRRPAVHGHGDVHAAGVVGLPAAQAQRVAPRRKS